MTTRRAVLAAGALLAVPGAGKAAIKADNVTFGVAFDPDNALLTLSAEFERLWAIEEEIAARPGDIDEEYEAARTLTEKVVGKMVKGEPQTLAELKVFARIVQWFDDDDWVPKPVEDYDWKTREKVINGVVALVTMD